jgi:hypothetical protein
VADPARIAAARELLRQLGVTIADLQNGFDERPAMPTVAEYLPRVAAAAGPGALRTCGSYWARMKTAWGPGPSMGSPPATSKPCNAGPPPVPGRGATAAAAATQANTSSPPPAPSTTGRLPTG